MTVSSELTKIVSSFEGLKGELTEKLAKTVSLKDKENFTEIVNEIAMKFFKKTEQEEIFNVIKKTFPVETLADLLYRTKVYIMEIEYRSLVDDYSDAVSSLNKLNRIVTEFRTVFETLQSRDQATQTTSDVDLSDAGKELFNEIEEKKKELQIEKGESLEVFKDEDEDDLDVE